ncbi:24102_t:CDS:1 [Cetraspora pellucida]|uniref:24102_t:CDS:1 n=1 Tax=Cetraspora pellucida TaxID=1433469 RepID=A0A9N9BQX9_9GLOM|nr:24102_t:CDS:1 [Cetraspora pellucida]
MNQNQTLLTAGESRVVRRQPRGTINRRACEKCRQLKIKCDGDAEKDSPCTNCDAGTCVFDKSPRKNRQVEKLNTQVNNLEKSLKQTHNDFKQKSEQLKYTIEILKLEKQIQSLLFDCYNYFNNCQESQEIYGQLRKSIEESRCTQLCLQLMKAFLEKLLRNEDPNTIISSLKMIAENTLSCCEPESSFTIISPELYDEIARMQLSPELNNSSINTTTSMSGSVSPSPSLSGTVTNGMASGIATMTLQSPIPGTGSDDGSEIGGSPFAPSASPIFPNPDAQYYAQQNSFLSPTIVLASNVNVDSQNNTSGLDFFTFGVDVNQNSFDVYYQNNQE